MTSAPVIVDREVLIVGAGLIGASIGMALTNAGVRVFLSDVDPDALRVAESRGAGWPLRASDEPDIVVVAVPPRLVATVAADALSRFRNATVTDVASVKVAPLRQLRTLDVDLSRFVGGHPMAGLESSGPASARSDLFRDRLWVVASEPDSPPERVADVRWLAHKCGSMVVELAPDAHDRAVALTSHTPHLVAAVLAAQFADADPADVAVSGQGVRDTTRLAASDPELWLDILSGNAAEVATVVRNIQAELGRVADALSEAAEHNCVDSDAMMAYMDPVRLMLTRGNHGKKVLPDKHGGAPLLYETVPVVIDDKPGEMARLFNAAGRADVNLEDVRILHTLGRRTAIVELEVTPEVAEALRAALTSEGWAVRG
ncbi:MAG: prephenate dehydrogenase [Actinomycetes bacterium]